MLTASQCATVAYMTENGELLCPKCFDNGDTLARPVIQYALDSDQSERWFGETPEEIFGEGTKHSEECVPSTDCEECGNEILEPYDSSDCRALDEDDDA